MVQCHVTGTMTSAFTVTARTRMVKIKVYYAREAVGIGDEMELERRFVLLSGRLYMLSLRMLMLSALSNSEFQTRPKERSGNVASAR